MSGVLKSSKNKNDKGIEGHRHSNSVNMKEKLEEFGPSRLPVTEHSPQNRKSDAYGTADRNSQNNQQIVSFNTASGDEDNIDFYQGSFSSPETIEFDIAPA